MNERIQKLADSAGLFVDLNGRPYPRAMSAEECRTSYEKFAELIVRECAKIASDWVQQPTMLSIENKIKWHFGVEE